eukprot:6479179-Amphidinium_carterae.1
MDLRVQTLAHVISVMRLTYPAQAVLQMQGRSIHACGKCPQLCHNASIAAMTLLGESEGQKWVGKKMPKRRQVESEKAVRVLRKHARFSKLKSQVARFSAGCSREDCVAATSLAAYWGDNFDPVTHPGGLTAWSRAHLARSGQFCRLDVRYTETPTSTELAGGCILETLTNTTAAHLLEQTQTCEAHLPSAMIQGSQKIESL